MRTIGMLGGMSWESTLEYYRCVNEEVRRRLGGLHSARVVLYSVDFEEVEARQRAADWDGAGALLGQAALAVERAGAQILLLCTNTMHRVAEQVQAAVGIPLLHIADATAAAVGAQGLGCVGLLGTRFTMEGRFYVERLQRAGRLHVLTPPAADRELVHRVIYQELCLGQVREESRQAFRQVIAALVGRGAQGVILGCTEIGLLVGSQDSAVPLFDTTRIHATHAVDWALAATPPGVPA